MNGRRHDRAWVIVAVVVMLALAVVATACSGPPVADSSIPPPAAPEPRVAYVALGADETLMRGLDGGVQRRWTQKVFTSLPRSALYVNLAEEDASVNSGLTTQLPKALEVQPTVATVWFGSGDDPQRTSGASFRRDLAAIASQLKAAGARVVLVYRADTRPGAANAYGESIQQVATDTGTVFLDLTPIAGTSGNPRDPKTQDAIADAIKAQITG